jgi:hypothetical protein
MDDQGISRLKFFYITQRIAIHPLEDHQKYFSTVKKTASILKVLFIGLLLNAQEKKFSGNVSDSLSGQPIAWASIKITPGNYSVFTDESGRFICSVLPGDLLSISAVGFATKYITDATDQLVQSIALCHVPVNLADVIVTSNSNSPYKALMETGIAIRGVANAQEILRMVPGLFIGQHQGGGKAEQIFLRGFDADHGHDISISADGIPVNMVSHAHGQGYADSHFIIPETIESAGFNKGPYDVEKGDMATAGYLDFQTFNGLKNSTIKLEGGLFATFRGLALIDLLSKKSNQKQQSWYVASEYSYTKGYFDTPEHFKRFNFFTKFNYRISPAQYLTICASTFYSSWFASGQLPERAVDSGYVGYYGTLNPDEGGITSRTNFNIQLRSSLPKGRILKNQIYFSNYHFDLHSDFTFFLDDPINGDEIRQKENRNLFGYNGTYMQENNIWRIKLGSQIGCNVRVDATDNTSLLHTRDRYTLLNMVKLGDIDEVQTGFYLKETLKFSAKWSVKLGFRYDYFHYSYNNKFSGDSSLNGLGKHKAYNDIFSPKLTVNYQSGQNKHWYLSLGKGFHSNDARVVVSPGGLKTLPRAYAADLGFICKPLPNLLLHATAWYLLLQKEYVYGGDGSTVEFSGRTARAGIDITSRYQAGKFLFFDIDINYAHGRSVGEAKGNNYIPAAPVWSSSAGINLLNKSGWNASLRYRYLGKRPANADYSLECERYFVSDLVVKYRQSAFEYGLIINNLFDTKWRETQLESVTRLTQEIFPVNEISFTPGTKFAAKLTVGIFF